MQTAQVNKVRKTSGSAKKNCDDTEAKGGKQTNNPEVPSYWSSCNECGSYERRYHLIEVNPSSVEWLNVCVPLLNVCFPVTRLMRIQNRTLWHRLQCERELMYRTHTPGFDLNERLLYHTSRADTGAICAEGLDQRLSSSGSFGRGIYFR